MFWSLDNKCFKNFSTTWKFLEKDFQHWVPFNSFMTEAVVVSIWYRPPSWKSYCLKFLIIYKKCVQVNFCRKVLPGNKTENDDSRQTRNANFSEDSCDLPFWVYSCSPQSCSFLLRKIPSKLRRNDFALYTQL